MQFIINVSQKNVNHVNVKQNTYFPTDKDAHIVDTNMTTLPGISDLNSDDKIDGQYAFYILYTPADQGEEESVLTAAKQMPSELIDPRIIDTEVKTN